MFTLDLCSYCPCAYVILVYLKGRSKRKMFTRMQSNHIYLTVKCVSERHT